MRQAAQADKGCDVDIPVNVGALRQQADQTRPLTTINRSKGAFIKEYFSLIGHAQTCQARQQGAFACAIRPQDYGDPALTKATADIGEDRASS
jgi:cobyric acid synthase